MFALMVFKTVYLLNDYLFPRKCCFLSRFFFYKDLYIVFILSDLMQYT